MLVSLKFDEAQDVGMISNCFHTKYSSVTKRKTMTSQWRKVETPGRHQHDQHPWGRDWLTSCPPWCDVLRILRHHFYNIFGKKSQPASGHEEILRIQLADHPPEPTNAEGTNYRKRLRVIPDWRTTTKSGACSSGGSWAKTKKEAMLGIWQSVNRVYRLKKRVLSTLITWHRRTGSSYLGVHLMRGKI